MKPKRARTCHEKHSEFKGHVTCPDTHTSAQKHFSVCFLLGIMGDQVQRHLCSSLMPVTINTTSNN